MEAMTTAPVEPRMLTLHLPDWQHLDTVLQSPQPFALWMVGPQPLLHHWLDHAVDQGYARVRLLVSDRPAEVRRAMEEAKLWPVEWEVVPRPRIDPPSADAADEAYLDRLPGSSAEQPPPEAGWGLLRRWFELRKLWFGTVEEERMEAFRTLALGRFCSIHPTAELRMPVWIEEYAQVGPGCVVGPNVNLGRGAVLEGPSLVENAVITDHTYLAGHTELRDAYLDGGRLLNLRLGAKVNQLDAIVADSLREPSRFGPTRLERLQAGLLFLAFAVADRILPGRAEPRPWRTAQGLELLDGAGPPWRRRHRWLREVVAGRMRLVGVLPRTAEQLAQLSPDWQDILRDSPVGVFAYSDLHGSHGPDDDLEAVHAVFQASSVGDEIRATVRENLWTILRSAG